MTSISLTTASFGGDTMIPIDNYGLPNVHHRKEAEAFLSGKDFYETWKKCVQAWNDYVRTPLKTETRQELDARYRQKVIDELSKSGIPNKQADSVPNGNYADYDYLVKRIVDCWTVGDAFVTSVGRLRQLGHANNSDVRKLQQLVDKINALTVSLPHKDPLKVEYEDVVEKFKKDLEHQNQIRKDNSNVLLKGKEAFLRARARANRC
jgi:hypothetical protein